MYTQTHGPEIRVLVLGDPDGARKRADELRLRGIAAWPVGGDESLSWLLGRAYVEPSIALVVLPEHPAARASRLRQVARLLAHTRLPLVVLGASGDQLAPLVASIVELPTDVDIAAVEETVLEVHRAREEAAAG